MRYQGYGGLTLPFESGAFDARCRARRASCVMHHVPPAPWIVNRCELDRDAEQLAWRTVRSALAHRLERPQGRSHLGAQYDVALSRR